jgi:hypothetical protein
MKQLCRYARHLHLSLAACSLAAVLSGCYVPENFSARAFIHRDGSYRFEYTGKLVFAPAAESAADGRLSADDTRMLQAGTAELRKDKHIISAAYEGNARYNVRYVKEGSLKDYSFVFMSEQSKLLRLSYDKSKNRVTMAGPAIDRKALDRMKRANVSCSGELTITTDDPVLESNGVKTAEGYRWTFGGITAAPMLTVALK